MNYRDTQQPIPLITPSDAERKYLDVLGQIELRRLELKRLDIKRGQLIDQIKSLEASAEFARDTAVEA